MTDSEFDAAIQKIDAVNQKIKDTTESTVTEIIDGIHFIGSVWTADLASDRSVLFAYRLNLRFRRNLTMQEVIDLAASQDTTDIAPQDLRDFYHTSVVVEAADSDGQLRYIAVVAAFAAQAEHAKAATRSAGFLSRFTGQPAYAVVAAMKMDDGFQELVAGGQFHWVCLDKRAYDD